MAEKGLSQKEADIQMMLAADVHLGTKNCDFQMDRYVFKRRTDGERAVLKFAQYTGAHPIAGRHTPGTFTNQLQTSFSEPRLLILTDPRTDHQPIKEAALGNIPTIAFCDTDSPMRYVDIGIPANNKGKHSIGCLFWLLARMVLQMRGTILPGQKWDVMVDLFFYREPEETKEQEEEEPVGVPDYTATALGLSGDQWPSQISDTQWVPDVVAPPSISAVPEVDWTPAAVVSGDGWDAAVAPPIVAAGMDVIPPPIAPSGWE